MPYTTQRNPSFGGRVTVNKNSFTISFKKDGQNATFPVSAKALLSLPKIHPTRMYEIKKVEERGVTIVPGVVVPWLPIAKDDSIIRFWLHKWLDGYSGLMIVSRRGLRRAARKAIRMRKTK